MRTFFEGMKAAQLQQLQDVGFWSLRFGDRRATWSSSQWRIFGRARDLPPFDREEFLARVHPEDRDSCARFLDWQQMRIGETRSLVFRFDVQGRGERWIAGHYELIHSGLGVAFGVQGLNRDVTDEVSNWYETLASRVVLRSMPSGVALVSPQGEVLYANDSACRILHRDRSDLLGGRLPFDFDMPSETDGTQGPIGGATVGDAPPARNRRQFELPNGEQRHVEVAVADLTREGQDGLVVSVVDVSEGVDIERRLAASEARLRGAFESSAIGMAISDAQGRIVQANAKLGTILGMSMQEMIGKHWREINDPSEMPTIELLMNELQGGERDHYARFGRLIDAAGKGVTTELVCAAIRGTDGKPTHYITQVSDVTERLATEKRLQEMVLRFRLVTETIDDVFWIADRALQQGIYVSPGFEKIWGIESRIFYSDPKVFMDAIYADDRAGVLRTLERQNLCLPFSHEYRIVRPDGDVRWILDKGFPVADPDGDVRIYVGVARDITAEKRLRESVDQAQRLEAIGQLTGQLAHDFNNLLSIVMMNAVQAQHRVGTDDKLRRQLDTILATTTRGGQVTKALLAVSSRQNLRPETCSIDGLIESARGLIETSAGPTTELRIHGSLGHAVAEIDPGAFSTALLNLVINARDSMPDGGVLTITVTVENLADSDPDLAAAKLPTGSYVVVEVADTGAGMRPDVLARVWEPFFTTKGSGRGSGLGLPAVYGFARQSRGTAAVASQPGLGTHVKIIIPQAQGTVAQAPKTIRHVRKEWGRILLVDDEPDLLEVMAESLGELGYTVSTAGSGDEALSLLATRRFDILLSDVAMRRMNGIELARRAQAAYPGMKILLMSGFAADAIPGEMPWRVLEKPLTNEDLAAALALLMLPPSGDAHETGQGGSRDRP